MKGDLGVMGRSISCPVGSNIGFICSSSSRVGSRIFHLCNSFAPVFSFVTVIFPHLPPGLAGSQTGQFNLLCFSEFSFWWQGIFFAKLNWTWWPHSFSAIMLQHMQYTVEKCVYFLYSALLNHKQQERQQHQQSAATMPSKPAVTGKCQCFKNPTPLMSAAVECVCSRLYQRRPAGATASIQQARTMHTQEVGMESEMECTPHVTAPTNQLTLWCHFVWTPNRLSNNSSYSFSYWWTESGNWAPATQTVFSWTKDATKAQSIFRKETQGLVSITDVAL